MISRNLILGIVVLAAMVAASGIEKQLARVQLNMKPQEVIDLLGQPTATIIAQPHLGGPAAVPAGGMLPRPGMAPSAAAAAAMPAKDYTMVFLYKDMEIELGAETGVSIGSEIVPGTLPIWAYTVRVAKLNLDQQELIYRINDTYSLGITLSGEGNLARVSDAIACSLKPLTTWPSDPKRRFSRSDPYFQDMFFFKYSDKNSRFMKEAKNKTDLFLAAGTSKGIKIGSSLEEVLMKHSMPTYCIPFNTEAAAVVTLDPKGPKVSAAQGGKSGGGSAEFATGEGAPLKVNFADNCILLYPDEGLALTLLNFIVVRIQIGQEMSRPSMTEFIPKTGGTPSGARR